MANDCRSSRAPSGLGMQRTAREDVARAVCVARDEVFRQRGERDEPPVRGDRRGEAGAVALRAVGVDAYSRGLAGLADADEDVSEPGRFGSPEVYRNGLGRD